MMTTTEENLLSIAKNNPVVRKHLHGLLFSEPRQIEKEPESMTPTPNAVDPVHLYVAEHQSNNMVASLIYKKRGSYKGSGENRKLYGDDEVSVTILTGFDYRRVLSSSQRQLLNISPSAIVREAQEKQLLDKTGEPISTQDVKQALMELWASFQASLDGHKKSTTEHVFEPLEVSGQKVPGCRVYVGNKTGENDPSPGTVFLQGLKISETVLNPAENGSMPPAQSSKVSIAKRLIRNHIPIGKFVMYRLDPSKGSFEIRMGSSAGLQIREGRIVNRDLQAAQLVKEIY